MTDFSGDEEEIGNLYECLKELELIGDVKSAKQLLSENDFLRIWEQLLHHAMTRDNCPVTKRIIIYLISLEVLDKPEIQLRVSRIVHNVSLSFIKRVEKFLHSDEFDSEMEKHHLVQRAAANQLRGRLGVNLLNPNKFT